MLSRDSQIKTRFPIREGMCGLSVQVCGTTNFGLLFRLNVWTFYCLIKHHWIYLRICFFLIGTEPLCQYAQYTLRASRIVFIGYQWISLDHHGPQKLYWQISDGLLGYFLIFLANLIVDFILLEFVCVSHASLNKNFKISQFRMFS